MQALFLLFIALMTGFAFAAEVKVVPTLVLFMKIRSVKFNNRKKAFEINDSFQIYHLPYRYLKLQPDSHKNRVVGVCVGEAMGRREFFVYRLASGQEATVHIDQILRCDKNGDNLREKLLRQMTLQAQELICQRKVSKRELARQMKTSPAQLHRLLDQTFYGKSVDQMLRLLLALDCAVEISYKNI